MKHAINILLASTLGLMSTAALAAATPANGPVQNQNNPQMTRGQLAAPTSGQAAGSSSQSSQGQDQNGQQKQGNQAGQKSQQGTNYKYDHGY